MEPLFAIREIYRNYLISSNSMSVPEKSDGCKNITGFPCAPIFGLPSPKSVAPTSLSFFEADLRSLTS